MNGTKDLATFYLREGDATFVAGYSDGDGACEDLDRKSVSGAVATVAGCRLRARSTSTADHAACSGESEIKSASEAANTFLLLQCNLEEAGLGSCPLCLRPTPAWLDSLRTNEAWDA